MEGLTLQPDEERSLPKPQQYTRWIFVLAVAALVISGTSAAVLLLTDREEQVVLEARVPLEVSAEELRAFADATAHPVYWGGAIPDRRLELTRNEQGAVYVRYLSGDARAGDKRPAFTTVATFPLAHAYRDTNAAARRTGMVGRPAPGGGIAVWQRARPTSVYLAYPGSGFLVEVYDPDPSRARSLALSGDVGPIR